MEFEKEAKFQVNLESQLNLEFGYDYLGDGKSCSELYKSIIKS